MLDFIGYSSFALFGLLSLASVGTWTYLAWRYGLEIPGPEREIGKGHRQGRPNEKGENETVSRG